MRGVYYAHSSFPRRRSQGGMALREPGYPAFAGMTSVSGMGSDDQLRTVNFPRKLGAKAGHRYPTVIPANAGIRSAERIEAEVACKITPIGVGLLDQVELPRPSPFLDLLLAQDCMLHRGMLLEPDQHLDAVICSEAAEGSLDAARRAGLGLTSRRHTAFHCGARPEDRPSDRGRAACTGATGFPRSRE